MGVRAGFLKLISLWRIQAYLDLIWLIRDPLQFIGFYLTDLISAIGGVAAAMLLAERFGGIGDWSKSEVRFMAGYSIMARGLLDLFFGYNVAFISRVIGRGQIDHALVQPQPLWMSLLTSGFSPFSGFQMVLLGGAVTIWAASGLDVAITPLWLTLVAINLLASTAAVLSFSYLWGSLAFWAPRSAEEISSSAVQVMDTLKSFPLNGASRPLRGMMLSFLPVGYVAWLPCSALLEVNPVAYGVFLTLAFAIFLSGLTAWVFDKGMKNYGRTGSQRYTPFGFRR